MQVSYYLIIPLFLISVIVALIGYLIGTIIWFERQRRQIDELEFKRLIKRINGIEAKVNELKHQVSCLEIIKNKKSLG
ncbi:MAG: hypothetical protein JSW07_00500 [bacterium]|nr:MAG: hypothetical protein JSW07_00500 [bacterium]